MEDNNLEKEQDLKKEETVEKEENLVENENTIKKEDVFKQNNTPVDQKNEPETKPIKKKMFKITALVVSCIIGILVGGLIVYILAMTGVIKVDGKVLATTSAGNLTESDVHEQMEKSISIGYLLELVDRDILDKKYELTEEQNKEVDEQVEQVLKTYNLYYGYTEEQFLEANGFENKDDFKGYMIFDYKRNLAFLDYVAEQTEEQKIKDYYDENVYGEINTKHMLVKVSDTVKDADAKKMAQEIIKKLDKGEEFDKVAEEYGDKITFEELGYNGFDAGLAEEYVKASKELKDGTYSKEPVKTDFGYHVIYRIDQKEKPSMEEAKYKILTVFGDELIQKDANAKYKALIKLRRDNGLEFKEDKYKTDYEEYCKKYEV